MSILAGETETISKPVEKHWLFPSTLLVLGGVFPPSSSLITALADQYVGEELRSTFQRSP